MTTRSTPGRDPKLDKDVGLPEKFAQLIDPPGREVSDDELSDPGANIPDSRPGEPDNVNGKPIRRK